MNSWSLAAVALIVGVLLYLVVEMHRPRHRSAPVAAAPYGHSR